MAEQGSGGRPGESFLARRARLKQANQRAAARRAEPAPETPERAADPVAKAAAPVVDPADLPPVESLDADADFTRYLVDGVAEELRRAALRKLFHLAEFNVVDGLNDYDDDYSKWEKLGDAMTYQKRRLLAQQRSEEAAEDAENVATEAVGEAPGADLDRDAESPPVAPEDGVAATPQEEGAVPGPDESAEGPVPTAGKDESVATENKQQNDIT